VIYFLQRADGAIKCGCSSRVRERWSTLQKQHGKLDLLKVIEGNLAEEARQQFEILQRGARHLKGDWFAPSPEVLQYIAALEESDPKPYVSQAGPTAIVWSAIDRLREELQSVREELQSVRRTIANRRYREAQPKPSADEDRIRMVMQRVAGQLQPADEGGP